MRLSAIAFLLFLALPATARADALLAEILTQASRTPLVPFERTTRAETFGNKAKVQVSVDRFDPAQPAGRQWRLVSIDGRTPTADEIAGHRKLVARQPVPGVYRLSKMLVGPAIRSTDAKGRTVYRFAKLPAESVPTPGPDLSTHFSADALVEDVAGKQVVTQMRVYAAQPFSVMAVARINAFDLVSQYGLNGGTSFLQNQVLASDVSAPFGRGGRTRSQISFRAL